MYLGGLKDISTLNVSTMNSSTVKMWLKSLGLKLGVKLSSFEMSYNLLGSHSMARAYLKKSKCFSTSTKVQLF